MSRLALSLLGPFQAVLDQRAVTGFRSDKARALLVFLAIEAGRPHARETLASLLWPDCPDATALASLRSTLSNLHHLLGDHDAGPAVAPLPFLLITRETVQLNPAADVWLDTIALTRLLDGHPALGALEQAVALCRGPFLEGFSIGDSEAFDEWLLFKREQLNRQALSALQGLTETYIDHGRYAQAQANIRRQLALDPWDEGVHRQLMVALALDGQRGGALAHYETCCRLLAQELSVAPARETSELYDRIRTGQLQAALTRTGDAASPSTPFVARDRELAYLDKHLALALAGCGRVVFVTGHAGSGKTTMINEFARRAMAAERDMVVAGGKCNALDGLGDPLLPFREIVQMLTGDIEVRHAGGMITPEHAQRLWGVVPAAAQAIAETAPALVDRFVPGEALALRLEAVMPASGGATGPAWRASLAERMQKRASAGAAAAALQQTDLFEQVTAFLLTLALRQPLILLVDDLQWADTGSISLLFHLGRRLAGSRILVVGAYRAEDVALGRDGERHPLTPVVHELQRDFGDIELDLNQAEGRPFVAAFLDSEPNQLDDAFRDTLYHHTEGHPLFTVELLRGLQESGSLVRDAAGRWVECATLDWERLPARVEAVIAERIGRLPAEWQAMLAAASVEGEEFTAEVVARVQGVQEREVIQRLSGVLSRDYHIVRPYSLQRLDGHYLSRYRFRHYLFRQYLYSELDELERARLHEATGTALETVYAASEEQFPHLAPQLAWHFEQAGNARKAAHYWQQAGDRAMHLSAGEDAIGHYMRGLALLANLPPSPERTEQELALQHGIAVPLFITRGWGHPDTMAALTRAYALVRALGAKTHLASALSDLSLAYLAHGEMQKALDVGEEFLRLAEQDQDPLVVAEAHRVIGQTMFFQGEVQGARQHLEQALALAGSQVHVTSQLRAGIESDVSCPAYLALLLLAQGYPDQAGQWSQRALARAHELGQPPALAQALMLAGVAFYLIRRERKTAQAHLEALLPLAAGKGWTFYQSWAMVSQGLGRTEQGQVQSGIAQIQQGAASWVAMGNMPGRVQVLLAMAEAHRQAGQIEQGLGAVSEALSVVEQTGLRFFEAEVWRLKGDLLAHTEHAAGAEVEACFERAIEIARRQAARLWELRATVSLARLWQAEGRAEEARARLASIYGWFTEGFDIPDLVDARTVLQELESDAVIASLRHGSLAGERRHAANPPALSDCSLQAP